MRVRLGRGAACFARVEGTGKGKGRVLCFWFLRCCMYWLTVLLAAQCKPPFGSSVVLCA